LVTSAGAEHFVRHTGGEQVFKRKGVHIHFSSV
jgi:hypothetical protein